MPITFDSLEELKEFYKTFKLEEPKGAATATLAPPVVVPVKRKPGRPPKSAEPEKTEAKAAVKTNGKAVIKKTATKTVVKPAKAVKTVKPKTKAVSAKKEEAVKRPKGRPKVAGTLTSKIQDTIQKFIDNRREFTANDIYADLSKREKDVNKQSVITSVLKQMNSTFSDVHVTERAGAGPRPVKVYKP